MDKWLNIIGKNTVKKQKINKNVSANLVNLLGVTDMAEIRGPYSPLCGMELVPFPAQ